MRHSSTGVGIEDVTMVAAHSWDISGGMPRHVRRSLRCAPSPIGAQPQIIGDDLSNVVTQLITGRSR